MPNAIDTLRGTFADCQDVLSAPDVDRGMAALADVEALLQAAEDVWVKHGHVHWCSREDKTPGPCDCGATALAAAVRKVKGETA